MTSPRTNRRFRERREEERRESLRQQRQKDALARAREEEEERAREEERREEARRATREMEEAYEKARLRREQILKEIRVRNRAEHLAASRARMHREELLHSLRKANRGGERERALKEKEKSEPASAIKMDWRRPKKGVPRHPREMEKTEPRTTAPRTRPPAPLAGRRYRPKLPALPGKQKEEAPPPPRRPEGRLLRLIDDKRKELGRPAAAREQRKRLLAATKEKEKKEEREAGRREQLRQERFEEKKGLKEQAEKERGRRAELARERRGALLQMEKAAGRRREIREKIRSEEAEAEGREIGVPLPEKEGPEASHDSFQSRLPSGTRSGLLPWLVTYDRSIATTAGEPLVLRGVHFPAWPSLSSSEEPGILLEPGGRVLDEVLGWGATILRVALDPRLSLEGEIAGEYLGLLDRWIERAAGNRCYTAVYLRSMPGGIAGRSIEQWMENLLAPWLTLSSRYQDEPAVIFDLDGAIDDLPDSLAPPEDLWGIWKTIIRSWVAELRATHPRALCFVSGLKRGSDLSCFPVTGNAGRLIPNLVYTAHLGPSKGDAWTHIRRLAPRIPVFAAEWGGGTFDTSWGEQSAALLNSLGIGWAANFGEGEEALLRFVAGGRALPAAFGPVVQRALALSGRRAEASQLGIFRSIR